MTGLPSAFKVRNERTFGGKSSDCEEGQKFACAQPSGKHQEPLKGTCIPFSRNEESPTVACGLPYGKARSNLPVSFTNTKPSSSGLLVINGRPFVLPQSELVLADLPLKLKRREALYRQTTRPRTFQFTQPHDQRESTQDGGRIAKQESVLRVHNDSVRTKRERRPTFQNKTVICKPYLPQPSLEKEKILVSRPGRDHLVQPKKNFCKYSAIDGHHKANGASCIKGGHGTVMRPTTAKLQLMVSTEQFGSQGKEKEAVDQTSMRQRRVAGQHTNGDLHSKSRRNGLCPQTDPAQQHLTFIRVLRKRF